MTPSSRRHALLLSLLATAALAACGGGDDDDGTVTGGTAADCTALAQQRVSSFQVESLSATPVAASASAPFTVPTTTTTITEPFCRVTGTAKANAASNIKFELWLPFKEKWNGKFAGTASGGSAGSISYGQVATHMRMNYASVGHDNGHVSVGFDQTWAYDPATRTLKNEQIVDWAYRAQHVVTVVGKELTSAFYGTRAKYAYYNGCSQSGHHGMMEVQRYPDDYDGVVAGAHTSDWTTNMATQFWAAQTQFRSGGVGAIPRAKYSVVSAAILGKCDGKPGIDHLADGVLDDPRKCSFDPAELQCTGADAPNCLTAPQVASLRDAYQGHVNASGERVAYAYPVGVEAGSFWPASTTTPTAPQGSWADYFRYPVFVNPQYDFATFNWNTDPKFARDKLRPTYDAFETDLTPFARRGKLLMYHGWSDSLISPYLTVDYWNAIRNRMGAAEVDKFARLYMIPGVDHCSGGAGTGTFEMMTALSRWVENGIAPDATTPQSTIVASRTTSAGTRTRPLCPYPKIAIYKGSGSTEAAENFTCQSPTP
ncbi:tannase/feruloyl esterase family alpha/beta hydrolase [Piscinibacter koreensis]|uniref:Tannase/feruloyl esterase family alpha/beta hydrolase n=1 Tax=Piscinibacter koreensis TaxID=2742824 RepID=A0A7Y6NKB4_9BURK|nr:tannase/feruloyl esterase family alpha/beta hydrolase [Schlegelella koreensis]NUZ04702.1 tannase/feruloyl esterase family alpha/beta hydrolase [Schlegelella koreensis]